MRLSIHLRIGYSHVRVGIVTIVFDRRAIAPRSSPGGGCVSCCSIYAVLSLSTSEITVGVASISAAIVVVVIFSWLYAIACLAYSLHDYLWVNGMRQAAGCRMQAGSGQQPSLAGVGKKCWKARDSIS